MNKLIAIVQPTYQCNMDCDYCYLGCETKEDKTRISLKLLENIISKVFNSNTSFIEFVWHGGEPLLMPNSFFSKIIEFEEKYNIKKIPCVNKIQTNGVLLTPTRYAKLKKQFRVGVSLDGSKEVHDGFRKSRVKKGTFDIITKNLDDIADRNIGIVATLTSALKGHIEDSYETWKKYTRNVKCNFYSPSDKLDNVNIMLDSKSSTEIFIELYNLLKKDNPKNFTLNPVKNMIQSFITNYNPVCQFNLNCCSNVYAINPYGDIIPCGKGVETLANINDIQTFNDLIKVEQLIDLISARQELKKTCCSYWDKCFGGCPQESFLTYEDYTHKTQYCSARQTLFKQIEKDLKGKKLI